MPGKPFVYESRVRFGDTDASGRIFYASMFRHFEAAEMEFLRTRGCAYEGTLTQERGFPRVHAECDFVYPLKFDDLMAISVSVEKLGRTSYTLAFEASVDGRAASRGKLTIVCVDRNTGRPVPLPEKMRAALA